MKGSMMLSQLNLRFHKKLIGALKARAGEENGYAEYQNFTDNLPEHLRQRVMICNHPDEIDTFSNMVIQKAMMLRR